MSGFYRIGFHFSSFLGNASRDSVDLIHRRFFDFNGMLSNSFSSIYGCFFDIRCCFSQYFACISELSLSRFD